MRRLLLSFRAANNRRCSSLCSWTRNQGPTGVWVLSPFCSDVRTHTPPLRAADVCQVSSPTAARSTWLTVGWLRSTLCPTDVTRSTRRAALGRPPTLRFTMHFSGVGQRRSPMATRKTALFTAKW